MSAIQDSTDHKFERCFQKALAGDAARRRQWQVSEGGDWLWQTDGVCLKNNGGEWSALEWPKWNEFRSPAVRNFLIEATISGEAEAAGLSFGPYKDFLAPLQKTMAPKRLQVELDADAACWSFRVDGRLMNRCWWDSAIENIEDLLSGKLTFKAKGAREVLFQSLVLRPLHASCDLSVILTCHRFLQRLRVALRNWCHQDLPSGSYEVLVVNPQSPDGTHEHLAAVARSFPHVRVREIAVGSELSTNKGVMINRAFSASRGKWIWLTDADCLFATDSAGQVLNQIKNQERSLFYGQRRYLPAAQTDGLLSGRLDGVRDFTELAAAANARPAENSPWGYTQIVHRNIFERVRYGERLNHFAHSDSIFAEECRRRGITARQVNGLYCLHLEHPFAWYGTDMFL